MLIANRVLDEQIQIRPAILPCVFSVLTIITYFWFCYYETILVINTVSCLNFKHFKLLCFPTLLEIYSCMHSPSENFIILSDTVSLSLMLGSNLSKRISLSNQVELKICFKILNWASSDKWLKTQPIIFSNRTSG